jgi:RNA recognition motif-containing protein
VAIKELYVGNLFYEATLEDVTALFSRYGVVHDARLVAAREPGHPHAFAFVVMEDFAADEAMRNLDGEEFMGLTLRVDEAKSNAGMSNNNGNRNNRR